MKKNVRGRTAGLIKAACMIAVLSAMFAIGTVSASAEGEIPVSASPETETITYRYDNGNWVHTREMEKLGRGLVAIKSGKSVYLSWRLLDSEDYILGSAKENVAFNVYRDGTKITRVPIENKTNYTDTTVGSQYQVAPVIDGVEGDKCEAVSVQKDNYFDIPVQKPEADVAYHDVDYTLNDASCGDLDGDGEYEIVVKWDADGQDNSAVGVTGDVLIDAYKMDGTFLWRVNLGKNIRAGAHYTQFLVYDFDGDGKAEMMCKTALGSKDSEGDYVTKNSSVEAIKAYTDEENNEDYRNGYGYIFDGDEFLTVFDGETGEAIDTIYYPNQRVDVRVWGDDYGNRSERFTATVAYMDGEKPYGVFMRGYYMSKSNNNVQRQAACAVSFDGEKLECTHSFDTYDVNNYNRKDNSSSYASDGSYKGVDGYVSGNEKFVGQGNHNCTTADVDGDGRDEVITGALCYEFKENDTLGVKWCTFLQHGDALHIGDYDPTHTGFEFFTVHEDGDEENTKSGTPVPLNYGMSVIDPGVDCTDPSDEAYNHLIMFHEGADGDTGRGMMGNFGMGGYYQFWSSGNELQYAYGGTDFKEGSRVSAGVATFKSDGTVKRGNYNFRIFWDGDLYDELLDGTSNKNGDGRICAWDGNSMSAIFTTSGCSTTNDTKNNFALTADLFGDWREELVMRTSDDNYLRVYTTTTPTNYKIKTLMQDPVYRMGVSAEQSGYNQPPHIGMYLDEKELTIEQTEDPSFPETPEDIPLTITKGIKTEEVVRLDISHNQGLENTYLYVAVYDKNGCLVKVKKAMPSETGKTRVEIERSENEDTVKVMAWTDEMIPIEEPAEAKLSDYYEVYYSQDYEEAGAKADWKTSTPTRYTPKIMTASDGNKYLSVNQDERYNNGTTLTSQDISYSGKTYAFEFDAKIMSSDDQTETELTVNSPAGVLLKLNEDGNRTTSWILNDKIDIELPGTNSEQRYEESVIDELPWYHFKMLCDMGAVYVSVSDEDGDEILELTQLDNAAKTLKGLKNMTFKTSRFYSDFGIDNVIIRPLTSEELELAPPPDEPVDEPLVSNSFDESAGAIIWLPQAATDPEPNTDVEGLTLYIGHRESGAENSVNFAYMAGGRTGNALVLNSGKFTSADRGPRFKINTPDMTDASELVAELYVMPIDGDGEAALYYNDNTAAQATTKLALEEGDWSKLTIRLKKAGEQVTRTIYVNDAETATDKVSTFPVFWGTATNATYSKLYFDDLTVRAVE